MTARRIAVVLLLATAAAPALASPPPPQCEVWNRELAFARSVAEHDAAAFAGFVHADAVFAAGQPRKQRGRDAIVRAWAGIVAGKDMTVEWYPTSVAVSGVDDLGWSSGPALFIERPGSADARYFLTAYRSLWHRDADGTWRVLFDDGEPTKPATPAEVAAFRAGRQDACPG
jgi:ketosteroid isomerase-like protein